MKFFLKIMKYSFLVLIISLVCLVSCFNFRTSNSSTLKKLKKDKINAIFIQDTFNHIKLNYLKAGENKSCCIVFIHGAPGANDAFINYMKDSQLLKKSTLIAIDRPGYGYSSREKKYYTIKEQSIVIGSLIKKLSLNYDKIVLVGHSYGASMVAKLAMDYNQYISSSIQISGAVDPNNEKIFWFSKLGNSKLIYRIESKTLKVTTNEKMNHAKELLADVNNWDSITKPYIVIHGNKDELVPYVNATYSISKLNKNNSKLITVNDGGHLLIWDQYDLIKSEIIKLIEIKN